MEWEKLQTQNHHLTRKSKEPKSDANGAGNGNRSITETISAQGHQQCLFFSHQKVIVIFIKIALISTFKFSFFYTSNFGLPAPPALLRPFWTHRFLWIPLQRPLRERALSFNFQTSPIKYSFWPSNKNSFSTKMFSCEKEFLFYIIVLFERVFILFLFFHKTKSSNKAFVCI